MGHYRRIDTPPRPRGIPRREFLRSLTAHAALYNASAQILVVNLVVLAVKERGLSAGEKRMLSNARHILISELALAEQTNEDKAEALLNEVFANRQLAA